VYHGTDPKNGIYYKRTDGQGDWVRLIEHDVAMFTPIDNVGTVWYFQTDLDAPRGRIVAIDVAKPARENWKEIIPQKAEVIDNVTMVNDELVVAYMQDAHNRLMIFTKDGKLRREIELPTIGTVGDRRDPGLYTAFRTHRAEMFFAFVVHVSDHVVPSTSDRKVEVFRKPGPSTAVRDQAGVLRLERRHPDPDVHHP
jgi:prolyl oligopeptidase PreP (S9A serine peptidase family)